LVNIKQMVKKTVRKVVKTKGVEKVPEEPVGGFRPPATSLRESVQVQEPIEVGGFRPPATSLRESVQEPIEEQEEEEESLDEIDSKIINRLKKTIIIKKELTEKQQNHLDKLATLKKGSKYKKVSDLTDKEVENIPIKKSVKKVKKAKKVIEPETESEETEESESEESSVPPPPKKKKLTLKPQPEPVIQPKTNLSLFRKSLF